MATNMPPHNLREVAEAVFWMLDHPGAEAEEALTACMERIKGPDFPTHGLIVGREGIEDAYRTGRGSVRMRSPRRGCRGSPGRGSSVTSCTRPRESSSTVTTARMRTEPRPVR